MDSFFSLGQQPFTVDEIPGWSSRDITISALVDGGWIVTWTAYETDDSFSKSVAQQRFSATGEDLGPPTFVNTYTDGSQSQNSVRGLLDGGWVVTWTSYDQDGSSHGVFQQRFNSDGSASGPETQVNTYTDGSQSNSAIAPLNDGGWVVTWDSYQQVGNLTQVFQQRFAADGMPVGEETLVSVIGTKGHDSVVSPLENGGWIIVWTGFGVDGSYGAIVQQAYASDGTAIGEQTQVNTHFDYIQTDPVVTALRTGGWVVTWTSSGQDSSYSNGVYQQAYSADGTPVGEETLVNSTTFFSQDFPAIVALEDGGWMVIWQSQNEIGSNSYTHGHSNIIAQRYDANGNPLGGEVALSGDPSLFNHSPEATLLENGDVAVVWRAENPLTFEYEIITSVYDITSVFVGTDGDDVLIGTEGDDVLFGGAGADDLHGNAGSDILEGGAGEDTILLTGTTHHTSDYVAFNASSHTQVGTQARINLEGLVRIEAVSDGGADADIVQLSSEGDAFFLHDAYSGFHSSIELSADYAGNESIARIANIEEILGMGGDDVIDLTSPDYSLTGVNISIDGGEGDDIIWGSDANEVISGGNGNDTIFGGIGTDVLTGGLGADVFEFTRTSTDTSVTDFVIGEGDSLRFYNTGGAEFDASSVILDANGITISYTDTASGMDHDISIALATNAEDFIATLPEILIALDFI